MDAEQISGAGLVCSVTPFTSPSILKYYKSWKNYKNKLLSSIIIPSSSGYRDLHAWRTGTTEREILVLVIDVDSDDPDELLVRPPGGGAPDEHPPPSVAAATLVWTRTWHGIFVGSFYDFLGTTSWDSSATYLFHFGWVHLLVDILTNATNNQRVSV